jgi:hypothetical protein
METNARTCKSGQSIRSKKRRILNMEKERRLIISANSAVEIVNIIQRYRDLYGNITILELLNKMQRDILILN